MFTPCLSKSSERVNINIIIYRLKDDETWWWRHKIPTISWEKYFSLSFLSIFLLAFGEKNNFIRFFSSSTLLLSWVWYEGTFSSRKRYIYVFLFFLKRNVISLSIFFFFFCYSIKHLLLLYHFIFLRRFLFPREKEINVLSSHSSIGFFWHPQVASFKFVTCSNICLKGLLRNVSCQKRIILCETKKLYFVKFACNIMIIISLKSQLELWDVQNFFWLKIIKV